MISDATLLEIKNEMHRAKIKWPEWVTDPIHRAAIVSEEAGELIQSSLQYVYENGSIEDIRKEAIHTAATAIRLLENL